MRPLNTAAATGGAAEHPTGYMPPKTVLARRYVILGQIGRGGMAAVYKARDQQSGGRIVAVKELSQSGLSPQDLTEAVQTFQSEADLLATLKHPGLPRIYDHFNEGGRWYLIMAYIEGETLDQKLRQGGGRPLPVDQVLQVGIQLCAVLTYLHTRRPPIIFRDLKPANVMLTPGGGLYLIDFGIARIFKPGQQSDTMAFGSPGYAAPEQYGKAQTTTRSDIYSLGATLHQLLTGIDPSVRPFEFVPLRLRNPQAPPELEALIARMVQLDERLRPPAMASVQRDLELIRAKLAARPFWPWGGAPAHGGQAVPAATPQTPPRSPVASAAPSAQAIQAMQAAQAARAARAVRVAPVAAAAAPIAVVSAQPRVVPVVAPPAPQRKVAPVPGVAEMRASKRDILLISVVSLGAFVWSYIEGSKGWQGFINGNLLGFIGGLGWGLLLLVVGLCLWFVAWLASLMRASQLGRWGWFTLMFLVLFITGPFGTLLYGLFGPVRRRG
jgi:tRNA A-37 threonylcarbamoyl transferase component Bud32